METAVKHHTVCQTARISSSNAELYEHNSNPKSLALNPKAELYKPEREVDQ